MVSFHSLFGDDAEVLYDRDFQVLLLANILPPLGSAVLSPVLDSLIEPFATTTADIGLMISLFTAPAIVMIPIAGVLADRIGRKPILTVALLLFGIAGTAIAFTTDFRIALGLRLLQGVAFAGIAPIIITSLGDLYDTTKEATAQGIRFMGSGISTVVFPFLSGILVVIAWHLPFLIYAIAIPIGIVVHVWFDEPTDRSDAETPTAEPTDMRSHLAALYRLARQRRALGMVIARALPNALWIGFLTYNSIVVVRLLDGTPTQAGILVAFASVAFATAASQAGRVTAAFDSRLYPLLGANVCLLLGLVVFFLAPILVLAGIGIGIMGLGYGLSLALYRSIITGLATESLRGGLVSLAESLGRVASTVTPIVMGGFISITASDLGLGLSLQLAGIGIAVVGGIGGIVLMLVVSAAPPIHYE